MSQIMNSLRITLGEEVRVEIYERVVKLYEKIMLANNISVVELNKNAFEIMTLSILDGLRTSLKQIAKLSGNERAYKSEEFGERKKYRDLLIDLCKSGMITYHEYEVAIKEPWESSLPWVLDSIKDEAEDLLSTLIIGYPGEVEEKIKENELEFLLAER
jgi:hypothetical protein